MRIYKYLLATCMISILVLSAFSGCITIKTNGSGSQSKPESGFSVTTASLSEATMTSAVDQNTKQPKDRTEMFSPQTQEIHCSVKLSNAPPNTQVSARWIYIEGAEPGLKNYEIDSYALTAEGTRYIDFSIIRPYNGWPVGDYQIILYIDGKQISTVPFYVR